jgi:hypothetical protein
MTDNGWRYELSEPENDISQYVKVLSYQLRQLLKSAEMIQAEPFHPFKDRLSRDMLRLRSSAGGFSLVSYNPRTPQRGVSGLRSVHALERALDNLLKNQLQRPGRETPEKELQSWLIREAAKHDGKVMPLNDVLGGDYWFVSDEIALSASRKAVADLLLVKVDAENVAQLVNVELKTERAMETFEQVILFRHVLEHAELQEMWKQFAEIMTRKKFKWQGGQQTWGIVVWPRSKNPELARANDKAKIFERVDVIGYHPNYTFERESIARL